MEQRERYMIWQGEVVKEHPAEGLYLSQEMLSLGHVLYNAERHIALLNRSAEALYGKRLPLSADQLQKQTTTLLQRNNPSRRGSVRITLTLNASGEYGIRNDEASIYDGFVMRSLSPKATYIEIAAPMPQHPTSAMAHTRELADALARCRGFEKGVIAKGENIVAHTDHKDRNKYGNNEDNSHICHSLYDADHHIGSCLGIFMLIGNGGFFFFIIL